MIRKCEKPDEFKILDDSFEYIECFNENGVYAYAAIDLRIAECALLHLETLKFSPSILKALVCDWQDLKKVLKNNNIKSVAATRLGVLEDHERWIKFLKWFGFHEIHQHITVSREI